MPRTIPRWAIWLTLVSLLLFGGSMLAYLFLRPEGGLRVLGAAHQPAPQRPTPATATDLGTTPTPPPTGFVAIKLPDGRYLWVAREVVSGDDAKRLIDAKRTRRPPWATGQPARGLSLQDARRLAQGLEGRLPSSEEWPYLVADRRVRLVTGSCEWVDAPAVPPTTTSKRRALVRCFRRLVAVNRRSATRRHADTVARVVKQPPQRPVAGTTTQH